MRVTKEQLAFLKQYVSVAETSTVLGDKLKIDVSKGKAVYTQKSKDTTLITSTSNDTAEEFSLLVQTKMFWDFLNTIKDEDELIITEKGISLGEDKSYTFESYNLDFPSVKTIVDEIETLKADDTAVVFDFKDYENLATALKYIGKDSLECVGLMKDKILGTDRVCICYSDSSVDVKENYFISKNAAALLLAQKGKSDSVRIIIGKKFYCFSFENTLCIFDWKQYSVPNLFDASLVSKFNHTDNVKVSRSDLLSALTRMSFFVSSNPSNRIFVTVQEETLLIENKDFNKSFEKIHLVEGNKSLVGAQVILNCKNLISFMSSLEEDTISVFINSDESNRATIRFEDNSSKYKLVHSKLKEE